MDEKIKIAIVGFGNIGHGVKNSIEKNPDMTLAGVLTRRPEQVEKELPEIPVFDMEFSDWEKYIEADVAILCGGSKNDLPVQGPRIARFFNTVDSFDNHKHIGPYIDKKTEQQMKGYLADMDSVARPSLHTSAISLGWDPGTFSLEKLLANAFIPGAKAYAFYGLTEKGGLSMGHSDAIRQIKGVKDARQYTHAITETIERIRRGENPDLRPGEMHWRECYVVLEADNPLERQRVEHEIQTMPDYFEDYRTVVNFISKEELQKSHSSMHHDGVVIASGETSPGIRATIEYKNTWECNPEGTAGILVPTARAVHRLNKEGKYGALRIIDIPPAYFSPYSSEDLTKRFM